MNWMVVGGALGFLGVSIGAFGAHAWKARLAALDTAAAFSTATLYHLVHALAVVACAVWLRAEPTRPGLGAAAAGFALGTVIFSGSLYALALTGIKGLGAITPIGGLLFLIGWGLLIKAGLRA